MDAEAGVAGADQLPVGAPHSRSLIAVIPLSASSFSPVVGVGRPRGGHGSAGARPGPGACACVAIGVVLAGVRFRGLRCGILTGTRD